MRFFLKALATVILSALLIVFSMQSITFIWDFHDSVPFKGNSIYNPYQGICDNNSPFSKTFKKSNFHAHTCFDTRHDYTTDEFIEAYKAQVYENIGITDHQYINPRGIFPAYEHGYGLNNFHIGMYNAEKVDWIDIPYMFFPKHQMQSSFIRLENQCDAIVFNHSDRLRLMSDKGIEFIRNYNLFELTPSGLEVAGIWDRVLSSGFYVPMVANDDAHSIINRNSQFQRAFTMVYRGDGSPLSALLRGHSYAVVIENERNAEGHKDIPQLESVTYVDSSLTITVNTAADSIRFIGQNGKILESTANAQMASYKISSEDTYVRAEVFFDGIKMFTNPIAKFTKDGFADTTPTINWLFTILNWILWLIVVILDIIIIRRIWGFSRNSGDNYYKRNRKSKHFENRTIGIGLKQYDWN